MSAKKKQIKAVSFPMPATQQEAEHLLATIGRLQSRVTKLGLDQEARQLAIAESFAESVNEINAEIEGAFQAVHAWAEAHKGELLKGDSKTAKLSTGELSWRLTPPAVKLTNVEKVLAQFKAKKLKNFIRVKFEVDKEAILKAGQGELDERGITGIKVTQAEEFVAKPYSTEIERVETVKTTKERRVA